LCLADRGVRKGLEVVINAWRKGFVGLDARLIVKVGAKGHDYAVLSWLDNRIEILRKNIPSMTDVFALADCYVYPSYGDGWGLTPRQAVAHGVPTIAPRHTGLTVGIDQWATQILETFDRPLSFYGGNSARWFKPQIDETLDAMLQIYHNRDKARLQALDGRKWLLGNQTWQHSAKSLAEVVACI
jgi:glycosyltransferase involved in cell wall biosynthesis